MEDLMKELAEASAKLKESVSEKAENLDERTIKNIDSVKRIKMNVSILAQILCCKFGSCNAKLSCDIGNRCGRFEIMLFGDGEVLVHCPDWHNDSGDGWKFLNEISFDQAKEIAECLIEMSRREDNIQMELV